MTHMTFIHVLIQGRPSGPKQNDINDIHIRKTYKPGYADCV